MLSKELPGSMRNQRCQDKRSRLCVSTNESPATEPTSPSGRAQTKAARQEGSKAACPCRASSSIPGSMTHRSITDPEKVLCLHMLRQESSVPDFSEMQSRLTAQIALKMRNGISKVLTRERIFCYQTDQDLVSSLWKNRCPDMVKNNGIAIKAN